jgi:hypothetical protein
MSDKKIKVAGYAKKEVYNGNIEYRNFTPDLVGLQLTSEGGTPLFTMGNFSITTNLDPKLSKIYNTSKFSDFYSLDNLNITLEQTERLLESNNGVKLNLDKTKLRYYALFGSLSEYVRVSLEDIIIKWPASLSVNAFTTNNVGTSVILDTFEDYSFNPITNTSKFKINTNLLNNKFDINYLINGNIANTFNETNDIRNLTINYLSYVIFVDNQEYPVLGFTGSTSRTDDYIYFDVLGDVFNGQDLTVNYHIKPNKKQSDLFFYELNELQSYLLNRKSIPLYKSSFNFPVKSEQGILLYVNKTITWPTTDGYNIDFDTGDYISYVGKLLDICTNNDENISNLMTRFLVSESITNFDTVPIVLHDDYQDNTGQKMTKTLNIYGRSFDEINNYIYGLSLAHTVTYNKLDNAPDIVLKDLAQNLGWDLISSISDNDLLNNYINTSSSNFEGESVGLTSYQSDIELWRRLILNSPWIWKSKGTRKTIEFFLKLIGTPNSLIDFNEYVYVADEPIDIELFKKILIANNLSDDLSNYPIDSDGYPRLFSDTDELYFQSKGLWYRETGGASANIEKLEGNNPHVGPYDGGYEYINQLRNIIPNFSATTISGETIITGTTNLFINYNLGEIDGYSGETYVDITNLNGADLTKCYTVTPNIISDPYPTKNINNCGCSTDKKDEALKICVKKDIKPTQPCPDFPTPPKNEESTGLYVFEQYQYNIDGTIFQIDSQPITSTGYFINRDCCNELKGTPVYLDINMKKPISGFGCCYTNKCSCFATCSWYLNDNAIYLPSESQNQEPFCEFTTLNGVGNKKVVSSDGTFCPTDWTVPIPNVTDPYTGEVGFGCKITRLGMRNYNLMQKFFKTRADGGYEQYTCCNFTRTIFIKTNQVI